MHTDRDRSVSPASGTGKKPLCRGGVVTTLLVTMFAQILICTITLGAYHVWTQSQQLSHKIGVVDLNRVFETIQERMGTEMLRTELPVEQREAIAKRYENMGARLPQLISDLSRRCNCVVAIRQAILTENVEDLTTQLTQSLEL